MFVRAFLIGLFAVAVPGWVGAGEALPKIAPPEPPFVAAPPQFGKWTITMDPAGKRDKEPGLGGEGHGNRVVCVKTNDLKRDTLISPDGERSEVWYKGDLVLTGFENSSEIAVEEAATFGREPGSVTGSLTFGPGFPGFGWLDLKHYRGIAKVEDKVCYRFAHETAAADQASGDLEAWVDVATRYPVAISADGVLHRYAFEDGAHLEPLELPLTHAAAIARYEAKAKQLKALEQDR